MPNLFVRWDLFFEALAKQPEMNPRRWLGLWLFDDCGVTLTPELTGWQQIPPALRDAIALVSSQNETTIH
jgi:hypothetical protein